MENSGFVIICFIFLVFFFRTFVLCSIISSSGQLLWDLQKIIALLLNNIYRNSQCCEIKSLHVCEYDRLQQLYNISYRNNSFGHYYCYDLYYYFWWWLRKFQVFLYIFLLIFFTKYFIKNYYFFFKFLFKNYYFFNTYLKIIIFFSIIYFFVNGFYLISIFASFFNSFYCNSLNFLSIYYYISAIFVFSIFLFLQLFLHCLSNIYTS